MFSHKKNWFELPDFRNLSIILAIVAIASLLIFILAGISHFKFSGSYLDYLTEVLIWFIPATLCNIIVLMLFNNQIQKITVNFLKVLLVFVIINSIYCLFYYFLDASNPLIKNYFITINLIYFIFLRYYTIRKQSLMPALVESKLIALTSSIRPHFLFNSLNAVISLIKTRPDQAEEVLQNMADLFRALLKKNNHSTLQEEIELVQAYIDIEKIRLGEDRLKIIWDIDAPGKSITPYLFLQPLLENAIYHGIENLIDPDPITVTIEKKGNWIFIQTKNPINSEVERTQNQHSSGYKMTLENLQERLTLMYSKDATLEYKVQKNYFIVNIRLPYYTQFSLK
ncbi:MAG: histidine kinase [Neisseriaceae bacterium]|nr:sensor histidine kinase [Neisseriaceae bacterium PsAf]MCV2508901.1 histidine kinase [Neisseriaceae bacterium]